MAVSFRFQVPLSSPSPRNTSTPPRRHRRNLLITLLSLSLPLISLVLLYNHSTTTRSHVDKVWEYGAGRYNEISDKSHSWWACSAWDPELPEEEDPKGCLRARQYRQVMKVLDRELLAEHGHWYFTLAHNRDTLRNISRCFLPTAHINYTACIDKPLIVSSWWYTAETLDGATSGEVIWQSAVVKQLKALGMHYIAVGPYENCIEIAGMMPDVYRSIWMPDVDAVSCVTDPRCIDKDHYVPPLDAEDLSIGVPDEERGVIKLWQLIIVDYWGSRPNTMTNTDYYWGPSTAEGWSYHPLGAEFVATPYPYPGGHVHLAYSIEDICLSLPTVPHDLKENSVLVFAKRSSYFTHHRAPPKEFFSDLAKDPLFDLILTAEVEEGYPLPEGLTSIGKQQRVEYEKLVGGVKVLLGMGYPPISPSAYTALCQATPVVLPYARAEKDIDLTGWELYGTSSQHGPVALIGPPYAYSYYRDNYTSLVEAVHTALNTPIERYIPPEMKLEYAMAQTKQYLETDWFALFQRKIAANQGQIPRLGKGLRERCYELKRCRDVLPPGKIRRPWEVEELLEDD